jgi:Ca2+-binding EF-hand superfamily protein
MVLAVGGFVVLAAAAGVLTARLVGIASTQRHEAPTPPPQAVAPVEPAAPALLPSMPPNEDVQQGDPAMKKSKSSKVAAVALGAATLMQAQQPAPAAEPQKKTAEEIIATNDLNGDGIVTLEEAAKVNGNLYVMFSAVYDADHDGRLDVAELKRGMGEVEVGTALVKITGESGGNMAAARPETILANNDLDKDGIVTKEEAKTAGKALYRMWDSYDLNKDGKVEYAELAKAQGY